MVINGFIVLVSMLLLAYWFRYTCLLVLRTSQSRTYAQQVASANRLSFPQVRSELAEINAGPELDKLHALLERDYRLMKYLSRNCAIFRTSDWEVEQWLLRIDFHFMRAAYSVTRRLAVSEGQQALQEMADIIAHMANTMGERAAEAAAH